MASTCSDFPHFCVHPLPPCSVLLGQLPSVKDVSQQSFRSAALPPTGNVLLINPRSLYFSSLLQDLFFFFPQDIEFGAGSPVILNIPLFILLTVSYMCRMFCDHVHPISLSHPLSTPTGQCFPSSSPSYFYIFLVSLVAPEFN